MSVRRLQSFNSYMVRFKGVRASKGVGILSLVSIPIWFDLKYKVVESAGSSGRVSIPIWFDLKFL